MKGSIRSMVEGWVTRGWAKKHHPRWYREVLEEEKRSRKAVTENNALTLIC